MHAFRQALEATAAVLEIQVIQPRHIADADDSRMSQMEMEMSGFEAAARKALEALKGLLPPAAGPDNEMIFFVRFVVFVF